MSILTFVPLLAVGSDPLALEALVTEVRAVAVARPAGCGAIATFLGLVRSPNQGRVVQYLEYEAYPPLALHAFARIQREAADRWPGIVVAIHHRTGRIEVGDASVVVVAASAHRADACQASRYAIERVKQIAPVWKREYFDGGSVWIEGAVAEPDDEQARQESLARSCA